MFDYYIEYFYLIPMGTFIFGVVMFALNHWDTTELEKKLMTNFKRFQIQISTMIFESIIIAIYFYLFIFKDMDISKESGKNAIFDYLLFILSLLIVSFAFAFVMNLVTIICNKTLKPKYLFHVNLVDKGRWLFVRKSSKNQILLCNENGEYLFISEWENLVFIQERVPLNKIRKLVFKNKSRVNKIIIILFLSLIVLTSLSTTIIDELETLESFIFILTIIILMGFNINIYSIRKYYL